MSKISKELLETYQRKLQKALKHLEYSYNKIHTLPIEAPLDEEKLETLESFTARMARVSDIFITKYLRLVISFEDPAFEGSVRDICNFAEKLNIIDSADLWIEIRNIRNATAHEYEEEDLIKFLQRSQQLCPIVLKTVNRALTKV
jgi:hypothetical protein